jgi:hypothetical protein
MSRRSQNLMMMFMAARKIAIIEKKEPNEYKRKLNKI